MNDIRRRKKTLPCFQLRDTGTCDSGGSCPYSHMLDVILKAVDAKDAKSKGKGKGQSKGKTKICGFFLVGTCKKGETCDRVHVRPDALGLPASGGAGGRPVGQLRRERRWTPGVAVGC